MAGFSTVARLIAQMDTKKMRATARAVAAQSGKPTALILCDMVWCGGRYQAGYSDYALFHMWDMNAAQRSTVLTRGKNNRYVAALNPRAGWRAFDHKTDFLQAFAPYMRRRWLDLTEADADALERFGRDLGAFIVKPADGTCGQGIERVDAQSVTDWGDLYAKLRANGQTLCEEIIAQHPDLNAIWPGSINTVRLTTILVGDTVHTVAAYLRVGNSARPVDNFNSGGMVMPINRKTGVISAHAVDKTGAVFETHPATGTRFEGYQIPMWADILALVDAAARVVPTVRYVGWDVAVTPDGPVLVEGNHFPGHDIYGLPAHAPDKRGVLPDWEAVLPLKDL